MNKSTKKWIRIIVLIFISSNIQAFALVNFFEHSGLLSSGLTGIGLILAKLSNGGFPLSAFLFLTNIPLAIFGFLKVGKKFAVLSFANIALLSFLLTIMPYVIKIDDILINAIIGGALVGLGIGLVLEAGASTGGTDFIALYLSVKKQASPGKYMLILNAIILLVSAYFFDLTIATYTLISVFVTSKVIDSIHIRYNRVTLSIITNKGAEISKYLLEHHEHGITIMDAVGGYSKEKRQFIYTVVSAYEINDIKEGTQEIDPNIFINVTSSKDIIGTFVSFKYD